MTRLHPQPGRWQFTFGVFGPVAGTATTTPFTVQVALNGVRASASGVPDSPNRVLPAGHPVTAVVQFVNTGVADAAYFVDGRLDTRAALPLIVANSAYTIPGAPQAPFPAVQVPTQTDALTVAASSDVPINFEVTPFPADHLTDLNFQGDPDREAGPAGTAPSVTVADPAVAAQTWLALPSIVGPFATAAPTANTTFTAAAHTRLFDPAVASSTGDPLLADVLSSPPPATPVTVQSRAAGNIAVTITPTGPRGTVVHGVLYLDTIDAGTPTASADRGGSPPQRAVLDHRPVAPRVDRPVVHCGLSWRINGLRASAHLRRPPCPRPGDPSTDPDP